METVLVFPREIVAMDGWTVQTGRMKHGIHVAIGRVGQCGERGECVGEA